MALFGESEEEKKIREQAEAKQRDYEAQTGEKVPEEPGIEPDEVTMGAVDILSGAGPVRATAQHGMAYLGNQVKKDAKGRIASMKEKMPVAKEASAPLFSDAVSGGKTPAGGSNFAKYIRGEGDSKPAAPAPQMNKETVKVGRFSIGSDKVRTLQNERNTLDLKTPEGRNRLKEIDYALSNRTYFGK